MPHVCWLGINPGVTSIDDAVAVLMTSDQIDRARFFKRTDSGIQTIWKPDTSNIYIANVWVNFDGNLVKSINFGTLAPFTMKDLISLLGEPDKIMIRLYETIDGGDVVTYAVYFSNYKAGLYVNPGSWNGPNPDDLIDSLILNSEFVKPRSYMETKEQPWLGYDRLKEYLPGQKLPIGPYNGPPLP
jgi:hypothetical protein